MNNTDSQQKIQNQIEIIPTQIEKMEDDDKNHHKCDLCQKNFSSLTNLKRHESILHLKKHWSFNDIRCNLCPKKFSSASEKIQHLSEVHGYFKDFTIFQHGSTIVPNIQSQSRDNSKNENEAKKGSKFEAATDSTKKVTTTLKSKRKSVSPKKMAEVEPVTVFFRRKPNNFQMPLSPAMEVLSSITNSENETVNPR